MEDRMSRFALVTCAAVFALLTLADGSSQALGRRRCQPVVECCPQPTCCQSGMTATPGMSKGFTSPEMLGLRNGCDASADVTVSGRKATAKIKVGPFEQ